MKSNFIRLEKVPNILLLIFLLFFVSWRIQAQGLKEVSGTVNDGSTNTALSDVSVKVKGSNSGGVTDRNGRYSIRASSADVLVFSFVGFETQEVPVGNQTVINISLKGSAGRLGEVIVSIGYGTATQKRLTTAISTVSAKDVNELTVNNVANAFTSNIAGVQVEEQGGPGNAPVLRVRGYGSINAGSDPLYVIDGMVVSSYEFGLLNPKTIASINVLKDAAAGAIYGSRAGNGVVIVTTKGGEGKAKFNYNGTVGMQNIDRKIPVLNASEYMTYANQAYEGSGLPDPVFGTGLANTNWQNQIFRTSPYQNQQISASGSNENVRYNLSFNYLDNEGIIITTFEKRYSLDGKLDIKLNNKLRVGFTFDATYDKQRFSPDLTGPASGNGGILESAVIFYPVIPVYMPNGDYGQQPTANWGTSVQYGGYGNPVAGLKEVNDTRSAISGRGRTFLNYEPIHGLNVNVSFTGSVISGFSQDIESPYLAAYGHDETANFSTPVFSSAVANQANDLTTGYIADGFVDYKHTFSKVHNFDIVAGFSNQFTGYRITSAAATSNNQGVNAANPLPDFTNWLLPNIYGATAIVGTGGYTDQALTSLFSRLTYDYNGKYLFTTSIRRDGSSVFAPNKRYGIFPAVSAGWRITEEPFMQTQHLFDDLKLRVSYGVSGNDQIGNYAWQGNASYGTQYLFGPTGGSNGAVNAEYPVTIENPNLKWETNYQFNTGVDFSILNNRVQLAADYYIRTTKDLLLQRPLPSENGIATSIMDNIGVVENKGLELDLTTTNIKTKNFTWTTKWIFNKVSNKAVKINTPNGIIQLSTDAYNMVWIVQGQPMFQIYGYKVLGMFKNAQQLAANATPSGSQIGDPIIEDVNHDGIINSDDFVKLGNGLPDFTYGWSNNFSYKNWDFRIALDGSYGASKYLPALRNENWMSPDQGNLAKFIYKGAGTEFPAFSENYTGDRVTQDSYDVFKASYVRIKSLTLGFNLPERTCKSLSINGLRFTLTAENVHTFTSYPWYSVQSNYFGGAPGTAQFGVDYGGYPLASSYAFGINLTF